MSQTPTPVVQMEGINKSFYGVPVLRNVDFTVLPGEVHALAGGNGAGKSTLMKILQGVYDKDSGTVTVAGQAREFRTMDDARSAGIGMVFQEFSLVSTMSVAQNVYLGDEQVSGARLLKDKEMVQGTRAVLERMGVELDPHRELSTLSTGYWQLTEIAKALHQHAHILIMDEPTASLSRTETEMLFDLIRRLRSQGVAIIYISHRMDEIYNIADRITILRNGERLRTDLLSDITPKEIVNGIVGREIEVEARAESTPEQLGEVLLSVENLSSESVDNVSFSLRAGEVLGLAGLMGSGRSELARCLFGVDRATAGTVTRDGEVLTIDTPNDAMAAGIALVPEDRREQGLVLEHSVRENLTLTLLKDVRDGGFLRKDKMRDLSNRLIQTFEVKVADPDKPVRSLSGGNQQKVVIAKWLGRDPQVLIMDEPTAGVDIGTKTQIIAMIRDLAAQGKGVLFISSEFAEMLAACDRFLLMKRGTVVGELGRDDVADEENLQLAIQGAGR